ncbi:MAG: hypothetical protein JWP69_176 [Flaviaesturariibacter sp.]|nr:hypothetical protein [Flaviaesturariibacter sp.]
MKKTKSIYSLSQAVSSVFMILTLLWLTVSTPFVYASQQGTQTEQSDNNSGGPIGGNEEESAKPLTNGPEEKKPGNSSSFSEEYLHDHHVEDYLLSIASQYAKCENESDYVAYHGELLVPPPNFC